MQNPSQEVHGVVELVNSSISPEIQMAAVNKFFTEDAGFRNPLFVVNPGPLSRKKVLGVFQSVNSIPTPMSRPRLTLLSDGIGQRLPV
jgi:hypothetical protein